MIYCIAIYVLKIVSFNQNIMIQYSAAAKNALNVFNVEKRSVIFIINFYALLFPQPQLTSHWPR